MNWIDVNIELPDFDEEVIVWVKYKDSEEFCFSTSEREEKHNGLYFDPYSKSCWLMGSAMGYTITHWMRITPPSSPA